MEQCGTIVYIRAIVQQVYGADRDVANQSYGLRLLDGQHLVTNVQNVIPERDLLTSPPETTEAKADSSPSGGETETAVGKKRGRPHNGSH